MADTGLKEVLARDLTKDVIRRLQSAHTAVGAIPVEGAIDAARLSVARRSIANAISALGPDLDDPLRV